MSETTTLRRAEPVGEKTLPEIVAEVSTGVLLKVAVYAVFAVGKTACEIAPPLLQLLQSNLVVPVICGEIVSI